MTKPTPTFILELPLKTTPKQESVLLKRLEAARQIYNAFLGETLRRFDLMRESRLYRRACKMPKGQPKSEERKVRALAFRDAAQALGYRKYDLQSWGTQFTYSWLRTHIASQEVKALSARAFKAVERYQFGIDKPCKTGRQCKYDKKGKPRDCFHCGRPRFKRYDTMTSVENITNKQGLRWREDGHYVQWRDLKIPVIVNGNDPTQRHGLSARVKYPRVLYRVFNGRKRFYVQLVLEGEPLRRQPIVEGEVGLDIGSSTIAIVGEAEAKLVQFCAELEDVSNKIRLLQRKVDRQRRANNPDNYLLDGRVKPGPKQWHESNRQKRTEAKLADMQRRQAAQRKSLHGQLTNYVLTLGNVIKTEKISYRAFQKLYGRSVMKRAPGMFVEMLRQKAKRAGGKVIEFSTYSTRLSQICHNCGTVHKKGLGDRQHDCDCGLWAQRDLYSAFLAKCVDNDTLDGDLAHERWDQGVGSLLWEAFRESKQANGNVSSFGRWPETEPVFPEIQRDCV